MNKNEKIQTATEQQYVAPKVEIIEIELQCAFNASSDPIGEGGWL